MAGVAYSCGGAWLPLELPLPPRLSDPLPPPPPPVPPEPNDVLIPSVLVSSSVGLHGLLAPPNVLTTGLSARAAESLRDPSEFEWCRPVAPAGAALAPCEEESEFECCRRAPPREGDGVLGLWPSECEW